MAQIEGEQSGRHRRRVGARQQARDARRRALPPRAASGQRRTAAGWALDTSRPSFRTNWTRLGGWASVGSGLRCALATELFRFSAPAGRGAQTREEALGRSGSRAAKRCSRTKGARRAASSVCSGYTCLPRAASRPCPGTPRVADKRSQRVSAGGGGAWGISFSFREEARFRALPTSKTSYAQNVGSLRGGGGTCMTPTRRVQTPRRPYSRMWESAKRRSTSWLHRGHLHVPHKGASRPMARHAQRLVRHWYSTHRARRGGHPRGPRAGSAHHEVLSFRLPRARRRLRLAAARVGRRPEHKASGVARDGLLRPDPLRVARRAHSGSRAKCARVTGQV